VLVVQSSKEARALGVEERHLADTLARQAALAIGRVNYAGEARDAALRARTEELRSSLLSLVSHDLRTPLAVITGAATTLRDQADSLTPAVGAELLATIVEEAQRLERVLANLLGITRVESGVEPSREWVPVEELVGAALGRLEAVIADRRVEIAVPSELLVHVDPILFEQVLLNLVENAVKHGTPPLEIAARRDGDQVELTLRDHGAGLPPGAEDKVFDKFFRASGSRVPGVGLGLAVVRGIVVAHGGTISAGNDATGGARFVIRLPTPPPPPAEESAA
jgi:two-component system sensor histidine kinase KdpD